MKEIDGRVWCDLFLGKNLGTIIYCGYLYISVYAFIWEGFVGNKFVYFFYVRGNWFCVKICLSGILEE